MLVTTELQGTHDMAQVQELTLGGKLKMGRPFFPGVFVATVEILQECH